MASLTSHPKSPRHGPRQAATPQVSGDPNYRSEEEDEQKDEETEHGSPPLPNSARSRPAAFATAAAALPATAARRADWYRRDACRYRCISVRTQQCPGARTASALRACSRVGSTTQRAS